MRTVTRTSHQVWSLSSLRNALPALASNNNTKQNAFSVAATAAHSPQDPSLVQEDEDEAMVKLPEGFDVDVTHDNFESVLPVMRRAFKDADFIAFDGEFTGLFDEGTSSSAELNKHIYVLSHAFIFIERQS